MSEVGLNNQRVRGFNKRLLLALLYQHRRASKSMLASLTGLSIPAISNILDELLREGGIEHSSLALSSRGLSGGSYQITMTPQLTLCMNITPTSIESQLVNSQIAPLGEFCRSTVHAPHPQALLDAIEQVYQQHRRRYSRQPIRLALAIHGQVDPVTGVSQTMPQAPWKTPLEIKYLLEERLGTQVMLDNDCVMLALAEKWLNPANQQDFCVINVDYGIGSSFVINRQIYRGSQYGSGQVGHTIVNPDGVASTVEISITSADGRVTKTNRVTVGPRSHFQINDLFRRPEWEDYLNAIGNQQYEKPAARATIRATTRLYALGYVISWENNTVSVSLPM